MESLTPGATSYHRGQCVNFISLRGPHKNSSKLVSLVYVLLLLDVLLFLLITYVVEEKIANTESPVGLIIFCQLVKS
jgi:hypothetical protein